MSGRRCVVINGALLNIRDDVELTNKDRKILSEFVELIRQEANKKKKCKDKSSTMKKSRKR
jgi:hypothetical protein